MNWKMVFGLVILAVAGLALWRVHLYLDVRAIAVNGIVESEGWWILVRLWPFAILAAIIGGAGGTGLIAYLFGLAHFADESERVKEYQRAAKQAERERDQAFEGEKKAQEIANRKVGQKHATLEQFKRELWQKEQELQARETEASELKARAIAALGRAEAIEARAKRRQANSSAAYNRKKQRLKKLEARLEEQE